jgi:hypothetical protein
MSGSTIIFDTVVDGEDFIYLARIASLLLISGDSRDLRAGSAFGVVAFGSGW